MNYIKHLTAFFDKVSGDQRFNPSHISLYMSLFQLWNRNMFRCPISINRSELMLISKISSKGTYHKCIKELHNYGYIRYAPSYNPLRGSWVFMFNFENSSLDESLSEIQTSIGEVINQHDTASSQAVGPYINNTNLTNIKNNKNERENAPATSSINDLELNPTLEEVKQFFHDNAFPEIEAEKFFNHFESNGWQIGGKYPMKDWNAAARSWILKVPQFLNEKSTSSKNDQPQNRTNYDEPL